MDFSISQTKEIHSRVSRLAKRKFRTMKDFYTASGVSSSLFSQYHTGGTPTSWQKVYAMCNALEIDADELLSGILDSENETTAATSGDGIDKELSHYLKRLAPDDIPKVAAFIQGLLASREE